ncbi:MAG TPA: formyltetrahydrofolate deformylase [Mycobacteriales bacterium]
MGESGAVRCVLTLSCPDAHGIVHAVSGFLVEQDCNITESQQYGDPATRRFFLRVGFTCESPGATVAAVREAFAPLAARASMDWQLVDADVPTRVLVLVSRHGHCLNDLLFRQSIGAVPIEVTSVLSNHDDLRRIADGAGVPFRRVEVTPETKAAAEQVLLATVAEQEVDLVVLARYMQILGPQVCDALPGRIINIHHSLLPSFVGANPYQQAHDRGVKLVGATAHYVTSGLDRGPIIEQDVARVDHAYDTPRLVAAGRDVECQVLARAVRWHAEHRILINGERTVVLRA